MKRLLAAAAALMLGCAAPTARNETTTCSLQLTMYRLSSFAVTEIFTFLPGNGSARTFVADWRAVSLLEGGEPGDGES